MPIGYPLPVPVTIPNDVTDGGHGWPILDATGWTTTLFPEDACIGCAQTCPAYEAATYMLDAFAAAPQTVTIDEFGAYSPALALGFLRAFHRYLYLLESLAYGGKIGRFINSYDNRLANFAEDWPFTVVSVSGTAVTISWTFAGTLNDPRKLALTGGGGYTSLQPWDIAVEAMGGYDRGPWAIVTRVEHGATNTTVHLHKAIGVSAGDTITFCGDRVEPVQFARPEPWTVAERCMNCWMDPTGSVYTSADPPQPGAPATKYEGTWWYCRSMRYASRVADFQPGICAYTDCSQYSPPQDVRQAQALGHRSVPASAIHAIWNAMPAVLFVNRYWGLPYARMHRVGHPSILSLCAAFQRVALEYDPTINDFGYVNKDVGVSELYRAQEKASLETDGVYMPNITWTPTPSFGRIVGNEVKQGLFRADNTGVVQAATPRWNGWGEPGQYAPTTPTSDPDLSMRNHPLRRFPSVRTNSQSAYRASWIQGGAQSFPGEFFVQRALPRTRVFQYLDPAVTTEVDHKHGTTQFDGDTLTVQLTRERTWTKKYVGNSTSTTAPKLDGQPFTGVVVNVYTPDANGFVRLDMRPAVETWHYTDFVEIEGTGKSVLMDKTEPIICAGNFVDAPQWNRVNNVFAHPRRKRTGCVFDSCQAGDTVDWDGHRAYVMDAAAHYGPEYGDALIWGNTVVNPATPPIVEVKIEMQEMILQTGYFWMDGVPANWQDVEIPVDGTDANETGVRLKMDSIWIELPAGVSAPVAGDVLTVGQRGIMAPPSIKPDVVVDIINPVTGVTVEVTEYDLDPALGLLTIENWTAAAGNCLRVQGWFLEAENRMQAETLLETRKALRRMDGFTLSVPVDRVLIGARYNGGPLGAMPRWDLTGNDAASSSGTVTIEEIVGMTPRVGCGFTSIEKQQNEGVATYPRAYVREQGYTAPGFLLGNVAQIMGLLPDWITGAWLDVYFEGAVNQYETTLTMTTQSSGAISAARISAHLIVRAEDGTIGDSSGGSSGIPIVQGWQTINITAAMKALCDVRKASAGSKLYLVIGGEWDDPITGATNTSLAAITSPFMRSFSYTASNGLFTAINARFVRMDSVGDISFTAQNMRLQLNWNNIEATDLPDLPYDTWPALVE